MTAATSSFAHSSQACLLPFYEDIVLVTLKFKRFFAVIVKNSF